MSRAEAAYKMQAVVGVVVYEHELPPYQVVWLSL